MGRSSARSFMYERASPIVTIPLNLFKQYERPVQQPLLECLQQPRTRRSQLADSTPRRNSSSQLQLLPSPPKTILLHTKRFKMCKIPPISSIISSSNRKLHSSSSSTTPQRTTSLQGYHKIQMLSSTRR